MQQFIYVRKELWGASGAACAGLYGNMRNGAIGAVFTIPHFSLVKAVAGYCLRDGCLSADQRDVLLQNANFICWMSGISFNTTTKDRNHCQSH